MALGDVGSVFAAAVFAGDVVVVVGGWGWGQIADVPAFLLDLLYLTHRFEGVLELLVLNFPLCWFLIQRFFFLHHCRFHWRNYRINLLFKWRWLWCLSLFTNLLMLSNSVRVECSSALSTGNQVLIGLRWDFKFGVLVNVLKIIIDLEGDIGIAIFSFFLLNIRLSDHGLFSTSLLMGNQ